MAKKKLEIDMIAGSQLRDTQGEMLSVEGADISDLERGMGRFNDNHGKGFFNSIGRVTEAKKIFSEEDCKDNPRHKYFWDKVKAPYIYVKGFLYDDEDHMNAKAAAAIIRNIHKSDCPLKIKASVEGGVIARGIKDSTLLANTKIHSVALTFTPANMATLVEPTSLDKSAVDEAADMILIKSVMHLAQHDVPSFRMVQKAASAAKIARNIKQMQKAIQQMKEDDLEKGGIKNALAGAAIATGLASAPSIGSAQQARVPQAVQQISHPNVIEGLKNSNPQLWGIAQAESSSGKNLNHKTMDKGMHKGQTAGGPWGMMPKTAAYVMKISPKLSKKYPELGQAIKDIKGNHKQITEILNKDPKVAYELAKTLHGHLKQVYGNDSNKMLHAWHYGINGTNKALKGGQDIGKDAYVQQIGNYLKELEDSRKPAGVKKALTAGYGGAGAPTGQTGGAVFQTESLEDGRPKFKYTTCEHCGNEQIHSKHQVKCRQCGKPWSLAKLVGLLR
jgi:hypothetical protein